MVNDICIGVLIKCLLTVFKYPSVLINSYIGKDRTIFRLLFFFTFPSSGRLREGQIWSRLLPMCWKFHGRGLRIKIRVCLHCWRWDRLQAKIVSIFNPPQESLALLSSSSCWFCSSGWSASGPPGWRSQRSTGLVRKGNFNIFGLKYPYRNPNVNNKDHRVG